MNKYIPENWVSAFERDCRNLVKKNLGKDIKGSFDIMLNSKKGISNFNLIVKAMTLK